LSTSGYLIIVTRPSDVNCRLPRVRPRLAKSGTRLLSPALQASDVYPPRRIYHPTWLNCWSFFNALLRPSRERRARGGNDWPSDVISRLIIDRRNWLPRELFERVERKTSRVLQRVSSLIIATKGGSIRRRACRLIAAERAKCARRAARG
jgi:hypothetical protein